MLIFLLLCSALVSHVHAVDPLVNVNYTQYLGTALPNGVSQWLGVRFAAPPLGELRFAAPQDPPSNSTIQVADQHGPICLATAAGPPTNLTDEDCLFLDVYAPSTATCDSKIPVFFFIQGGGFNADSNPDFNGSGLVTAGSFDVIVVTFNYRVGPYGFLASEEVLANGGTVNNGLRDQRKALQWVQQYISRFGGDPGHVTMGGDSAGAASVNLQLTANNGTNYNLFHATAAESQSFAAVRTIPESQYQYDNLVIRTQCVSSYPDTLACLRNLSATDLQAQNINTAFPGATDPPLYMYGPVLDFDFVTDYTYSAYAKGNFIKLAAIYGDDTNEGTIFTPNSTANISQSDTFLKDQFPNLGLAELAVINSLYPQAGTPTFPNSGAYWRQVSNAYGELRYICPGIFISETYAAMGLQSSWNYHWNVLDPTDVEEGFGVTHTSEVNAIFGPQNVNGGAPASYNTSNAAIVPVIQGYWTSFIRSYNPNTYRLPGSPVWQTWQGSPGGYGWDGYNGTEGEGYNRLLMQTNATAMEVVPPDQRARCAYLTSIGLKLKQ